jgi:hypothetical protein
MDRLPPINAADFCSTLTKWCDAISDGRFDDAALAAQSLTLHGDLIRIHPQFERRFERCAAGLDARQALATTSTILGCIAEAMKTDADVTSKQTVAS